MTLADNDQDRTIALGGTNADDNTLAGSIGDAGTGDTTLAKNDAGTWVLTGTNTYTGNTIINAGTLKIGGGGTTGSIVSDTIDLGTLVFDRSNEYIYDGVISNVGNVEQAGSGTTVLTADSTYTGGTTISDGTLQLGNGGASGSILGNVTDDGVLAFDRSDVYTFGGVVSGSGSLSQIGIGTTILTRTNTYSGGTTITDGILQVGDGGTNGSIVGDVANAGALVLNRSDDVTFAGLVSGAGTVEQAGVGTTILTADNSYAGVTNVNVGTLFVNGDQSAAAGQTNVASGATLGGNGIIGGDVVMADGATLAAGNNDVGTLTINGGLSLSSGTALNYEFGEADVAGGSLNDLVNVGGDLLLDGTVNVSVPATGSFGAGIYRMFNYGGTLDDQGLTLGTMPSGSEVIVQTAIAGQVNLVNSAGLLLNFWDGDAGPKNDGVVNGGNGTWQNSTGNKNWADQNGNINAGYDDGGFAIFVGTGGTVTVDNSLGAVTASGMQFASDGYRILGDALTLVGLQSTVRVGDGTAAGAGMTAIIDANLAGNTELVKTDTGTLVLTGTNTYSGGTAIDGGALQVATDTALGDVGGGLSFDGGTLHTTADMTTARGVTLIGAGTLLTDSGTTLDASGDVAGAGMLTKDGAGALVLTGDATHTGGTTIAAGTLQIGNGSTSGSIAGDVIDNGALVFDRADDTTFVGNISGTGAVSATGGGILRLTGDSTYAGATTVTDSELRLESGGTISNTSGTTLLGSNATLTVTGEGSAMTTTTLSLSTGTGDPATVNVEDGGHLAVTGSTQVNVGSSIGNMGTVNVAGPGSLLDVAGAVVVSLGPNATGAVNITDGGKIQSGSLRVGPASIPLNTGSATVTISGAGSQWTTTALLLAEGSVSVLDGAGFMSSGSTTSLGTTGAGAQLLVSGAGSSVTLAGNANIGATFLFGAPSATGTLTIAAGALVDIGGVATLGQKAGTTGILNIGGAEGDPAAGAGAFDAASLVFGPGAGRLNFNHTDTDYQFATPMSGAGTINQVAGVTALTGDSSAFTGTTSVSGGTLLVNNTLGGDVGVATGGTLGGAGMIGGDVTVADGSINPGDLGAAPGTLTINGKLSLDAGSTLNYNFGQANVAGGAFNDLIKVGGDLTLGGTLNVQTTPGASFDPGVYRVISYEGGLTNNGLSVGTIPSPDFYVQTSIDHQVNLVNTAGMTLRYWDGATIASKNSGTIEGGNGTWQNLGGNDNWTEQTGVANAPFDDAAFAVFMGAAGTVSVDDSLGAVNVSGMQFATDKYEVKGGIIKLVGGSSIIRVGDGTTDGAAFTTTIDSELAGVSQLVKTDLGTLVLTGVNSYTGGTAINGGTLEIGADGNLGAAGGGISFDGGTLRTSADLVSGRSVAVSGDGTIATDEGTTFTLNGALSGSGTLTKDGAGTLLVTADNSGYAGTSRVAAGTFAVDGALGGQVDVADGGRLEGNGEVGSVTNAGVVAPGRSIGTLTIAGDYAGKEGGSLEIETTLGGDNSPSDLLVVNGDTSGSTGIDVINRGGLGEQTRNGIKVVDVAGASNGTFTLNGDYVFDGKPAVVAGAYGYRLYKNGIADPSDGDWYLRSSLLDPAVPGQPGVPLYQPGVPLYESYAGSLQQFNQLGTLQQRVGNRMWAARADGAQGSVKASKANDSSGVWLRIEAAHAELEPAVTTSGANYDASTWKFQAGIDNLLMKNRDGRLISGLFAQYGTISSGVWSPYGVGGIDTTAYGVGTTMTWYGESGFYADGQAQVTWYDSDLDSATAGRSLVTDNDGIGYGVSMEAGRRIPLTETWSLTPQAQLAGSWVRFDDFTDAFGADVSLDHSHSLIGRLGIASNHDVQWRDANRRVKRAHVYAIANVYYDFEGESKVDVAGTPFASRNDRLYGGVGLGGSLNWADDKYSLYGEARLNTSLENPGDSNIIGGTVGFRMRW